MPVDRMLGIKAGGFRGFNIAFELDLDHPFVIVYGPNGEGKTSVAEAVEWLLFGRTSKRDLASDNREEHQNSFRNAHHPAGSKPYIEATLLADGRKVVVRRELLPNEDTMVFVDGREVPSLALIGVLDDHPYPTIPQHGLKSFIHTAPRNRWESFSKILGLQQLARLKAELDEATRNFRNSRSVSADNLLRQSREVVRTDRSLATIQAAISESEGDASKFLSELHGLVRKILNTQDVTLDETLERLESLRAERESKVVDLSALRLPQFSGQLEAEVKEKQKVVEELAGSLSKELPTFIQSPERYAAAVRAEFLERGLSLISKEEPSVCPFCGQQTLVGDVPDRIRHLLKEAKEHDATRLRADFRSQIISLTQAGERILGILRQCLSLPRDPSVVFAKARRLLPTHEEIDETWAIVGDVSAEVSLLHQQVKDITRLRSALEEALSKGEMGSDFTQQLKDLPHQIKARLENGLALRERFSSSEERLRHRLQKLILEADEVKEVDRFIFLVRNRAQIVQALREETVLRKLENLRAAAIAFEVELTKQRLVLFRDDVLRWYNLLNPDEPIRLKDIRESSRRPRNLDLEATSYGESISAAACLSECHTNCVGLSVYLAQCTSDKQPFRFIVIDDPVQSMDSAHTGYFEDDVIHALLDAGFQVILLVHQKEILNSVFTIFRGRDPLRYEFYGYDQAGPKYKLLGASVQEYLESALSFRLGDSEKRRAAGNALRCATERLVKDIYASNTGTRLSVKHEHLSGDQLRDLLSKCSSVAVDDVGRINELISRMNPRSHDRATSEPPTSQEIQAMVDRISTIYSKYLKAP